MRCVYTARTLSDLCTLYYIFLFTHSSNTQFHYDAPHYPVQWEYRNSKSRYGKPCLHSQPSTGRCLSSFAYAVASLSGFTALAVESSRFVLPTCCCDTLEDLGLGRKDILHFLSQIDRLTAAKDELEWHHSGIVWLSCLIITNRATWDPFTGWWRAMV